MKIFHRDKIGFYSVYKPTLSLRKYLHNCNHPDRQARKMFKAGGLRSRQMSRPPREFLEPHEQPKLVKAPRAKHQSQSENTHEDTQLRKDHGESDAEGDKIDEPNRPARAEQTTPSKHNCQARKTHPTHTTRRKCKNECTGNMNIKAP